MSKKAQFDGKRNQTTTDFPIGSIYGRNDSREVRAAFFDAIKAKGKIARRRIVTFREIAQMKERGQPLSSVITYKDLLREQRKREMAALREARKNKPKK